MRDIEHRANERYVEERRDLKRRVQAPLQHEIKHDSREGVQKEIPEMADKRIPAQGLIFYGKGDQRQGSISSACHEGGVLLKITRKSIGHHYLRNSLKPPLHEAILGQNNGIVESVLMPQSILIQ